MARSHVTKQRTGRAGEPSRALSSYKVFRAQVEALARQEAAKRKARMTQAHLFATAIPRAF